MPCSSAVHSRMSCALHGRRRTTRASLASGGLQNVEQYTLELEGIAQLDWTAEQMAKQTEVQYLLDEENEETAESEAFSEESAELSE